MAVPICIRCRHAPCRCTAHGALDEENREIVRIFHLLQLRLGAQRLSPAYVAWLDSGKFGPEPLIPADVRRQIHALMVEMERMD